MESKTAAEKMLSNNFDAYTTDLGCNGVYYKDQVIQAMQEFAAQQNAELIHKAHGFDKQTEFFTEIRNLIDPTKEDKHLPWYEMLLKCIANKQFRNADLIDSNRKLREALEEAKTLIGEYRLKNYVPSQETWELIEQTLNDTGV